VKTLNRLVLAASLLITTAGCTVISPDAGQEAVLIDKPWIFGHGGVRDERCDRA